VYLYSVDDLSEVVERNRKAREMDIEAGMDIVYKNTTDFMDWLGAKDIGPLIGQMKQQFIRISQSELEHFFVGTRQEASCKENLEIMVNRVVNKLLHCVIKNVNTIAKENGAAEAAKFVDSIVQHAEKISSDSNNNGDEQS
jgi:glutamyl-tRNA reductase